MSSKTQIPPTELETVLVVEDEILVRTAIAEYLRHCGYRVVEAASADEAMTVLQETAIQVDIVFSDIKMPGSIDGFGLSKWVREHKPGLQIILTGTLEKTATGYRMDKAAKGKK